MRKYLREADPTMPCRNCGRPRYQQTSGKWRCRECHNRPPEKDSDFEEATCECGATFRRRIHRGARRCDKCHKGNAKGRNPTREQIKALTAALQATWTDRERYRRAGIPYTEYEIPQHDSGCIVPGGFDDRDTFNF
jgi:ribosomal protein L37AE/L43A